MNAELAEQIIGIILMEPERFCMDSFVSCGVSGRTIGDLREEWPCGTTACIAGHAAVLTLPADTRIIDLYYTPTEAYIAFSDGRHISVHDTARDALGITEQMADYLFYEINDDQAVMALKYIIGNPGATSSDLHEFLGGE